MSVRSARNSNKRRKGIPAKNTALALRKENFPVTPGGEEESGKRSAKRQKGKGCLGAEVEENVRLLQESSEERAAISARLEMLQKKVDEASEERAKILVGLEMLQNQVSDVLVICFRNFYFCLP
jgi:hypothetical protein